MPVTKEQPVRTENLSFRTTEKIKAVLAEIAASKRWSTSSLCELLITTQLKLMMAEEGYSQGEIDEIT